MSPTPIGIFDDRSYANTAHPYYQPPYEGDSQYFRFYWASAVGARGCLQPGCWKAGSSAQREALGITQPEPDYQFPG